MIQLSQLEAIGVVVDPLFGITHVVCRNAVGKTKTIPSLDLILFINSGNELYTLVGGSQTLVEVVGGTVRRAYIRTKANDSIEDNLLSLPRY